MRLSRADALGPLAVIGLLSGLLSGAVIVAFRLLVEDSQTWITSGTHPEEFENLDAWTRFFLPLAGGVILALLFRFAGRGQTTLGVANVMERMAYHQGHLSLRGFLLQFAGAATALVSGHSVGREGPHIYLGAAASSLFGQRLGVPNNTIRVLVGCGTAAGIAASFNTPLAGVVFALEVVMLEYTVSSFVPIMLAAAGATVLSNAVLGAEPVFAVPALSLAALDEIPLVIALGLAAGAVSALFIETLKQVSHWGRRIAIERRLVLAGLLMGIAAAALPEVMGTGYDTVNAAIGGQLTVGFLLLLVVAKMFATSATVGLGVPGGTIGPALVIGACLGAATGLIADWTLPELKTHVGFFALIGMAAVMAGSLQAPLAAITALLELTHAPGLIMPAMVAVVIANLTASELFHKESLFITLLRSSGLSYDANPVAQALRRMGVGSIMERDIAIADTHLSRREAERIALAEPAWVLISNDGSPHEMFPGQHLARFMAMSSGDDTSRVELNAVPAERMRLQGIDLRATLQEALELLEGEDCDALYVYRRTGSGHGRVMGVVTLRMVESAYRV